MHQYIKQGNIPPKKHTSHISEKGNLYFEEHISRHGFSDIYSNLYHLRMPTCLKEVKGFQSYDIEETTEKEHKPRHFLTGNKLKNKNIINARIPYLYNDTINIFKAYSSISMDFYYRNGHYDELYYIQSGSGYLLSNFGDLDVSKGDFIIIPRGILWKLDISEPISALVIESKQQVRTPKRYRNQFGQLLEHSPFCERDFKLPKLSNPINLIEDTRVLVRLKGGYQEYIYEHNPMDVVGWDGYYYPWIFNINDFEPITGSLHQPPPVHQVFENENFVVCAFVPRLFDYHEKAIPAPYPHSNVDSDEVIFYSKGNFMSRSGVSKESITFHPMGLPHGPQPGRYEQSIGKNRTDELAVMIDTFASLKVSKESQSFEDKAYYKSWIKKGY